MSIFISVRQIRKTNFNEVNIEGKKKSNEKVKMRAKMRKGIKFREESEK